LIFTIYHSFVANDSDGTDWGAAGKEKAQLARFKKQITF
jgi:hypothetical protein